MIKGTKFRAYRKRDGKGVHASVLHPKGWTLTCDSFVDGIITCKEKIACGLNVQIFPKHWNIHKVI